jgi:hypothetical protein
MRSARIPPGLHDIVLSRPLFYAHSLVAGVSADTKGLLVVCESLVDRCYRGDVEEYLAAQGRPQPLIDVIRENLVGEHYYYGRTDAILSAEGFRIIELNVGSELGGYSAGMINRAVLEQEEFAAFAADYDLHYVEMRDVLIDRLHEVSRQVVGVEDPVVAVVEETGSGYTAEVMMRTLEDRGLRVVIGELSDLSSDRGKIVIHGKTRVDVVLRYFFPSHLLTDAGDRRRAAMLTRAHQEGHTALFTPMDSALHESKATFGLMYHPPVWARLTEAERSLVRRVVPWTRLLGADFPAVSAQDRREAIEECRERREHLVLKPAGGRKSEGVYLGAAMSDKEWAQALQIAATGDYLAQERVVPVAHQMVDPDTKVMEDWHAILGVFCDDGGYGGTRVMGQPARRIDLVDWGIRRYGCAFTYE